MVEATQGEIEGKAGCKISQVANIPPTKSGRRALRKALEEEENLCLAVNAKFLNVLKF